MEPINLRDGTRVKLRKPVEADAEALLVYLDAVRNETDFIAWARATRCRPSSRSAGGSRR